ncbi:MAG: TetR/AcrR family transcriptional regulator [Deltaproteobacteria bacterium]|jgi:AcrR family transcriptional regulator|nr:TetR/AcrR family transcriptional regulator [Deltaproteobacteria bacterium]
MPPAATRTGPRRVGRPKVEGLTERRREEILDAATRVFAETGYAGTDLDVVARAVGVAKGTIYRYFASKEALFYAAVDRGMWQLRAALDAAMASTTAPVGRIEAALTAYLRFFDQRPAFVELLILERAEFRDRDAPSYFTHREAAVLPWRKLVRQLVADGTFRAASPERVTDLVSDLLYGALFTNHFRGKRADVDAQVAEIKSLLLLGLLPRTEDGARRRGPR